MKPLQRRIAKLENAITPKHQRVRLIHCKAGETTEAAKQRYNAENPDDLIQSEDDLIVIVSVSPVSYHKRWCLSES
jgi:hypothetical protein